VGNGAVNRPLSLPCARRGSGNFDGPPSRNGSDLIAQRMRSTNASGISKISKIYALDVLLYPRAGLTIWQSSAESRARF
jgi:hypothetical protein